MEETLSMARRHGRILQAIAADGAEIAALLAADVREAETPPARAAAAAAWTEVTRAVRITVALEARLARDARRGAEEDRKTAVEARKREVDAREAQVSVTLKRRIREERDRKEVDRLDLELYGLLIRETKDPAFASEDLEALIARLARQIGLNSSHTPPTVIPDAAQPRSGTQATPPSAPPREGGDPSGASTPTADPSLDSAWVPAVAATGGEGAHALNSS